MPKQFLKTIQRAGLGKAAFYDMRYDDKGAERPEFVLNQEPYRHATIMVAGANFGCGSSREHAPWGILDFGVRCIIAPSFADIFFNNCFKNGLLAIKLEAAQVDQLIRETAASDGYRITVDLVGQTVTTPGGASFPFQIDAFRKHCLINGLDEIGLTLQHADKIRAFEASRKAQFPWYFR